MRSHRDLRVTVLVLALGCVDPNDPVAPPGPSFISSGVFDGNGHPSVGALFADFNGDETIQGFEVLCSGSLIAQQVFLTAAHCLAFLPGIGISQVWVSFDPQVLDADGPNPLIAATGFAWDPQFGRDLGDLHDLGVVLLPAGATAGLTPVQLPSAGLLDQLAARGGLVGQSFTNVGYGVMPAWKGSPPRFAFDGRRNTSTSPFMGLTRTWLKLLMNNDASGEGGVCFGDSGSPHFLGGSNLAVATTTGGDGVCRALNYNYRLDTQSARGFLATYVTLP